MRSSNKSRSRNKHNNNNNRRNVGNVINRVFDSAGPEGRVRGTPSQVIEKYQGLARDAQLSGDRVAAENFQQHAEHYNRVLGEAQQQQAERMVTERAQQQSAAQNDAQRHQPQPVQNDAQRQHPQSASNGADANGSTGYGMATVDEQTPEPSDGGLVDTPENAPKPQQARGRGPRKPRVAKEQDASSNQPSSPNSEKPAE